MALQPPRLPWGCYLTLGIFAALIVLFVAGYRAGIIIIPPNTLPWNAPKLDARAGWLAHYNVLRLKHNRDLCTKTLTAAKDIGFTPLADQITGSGCGFSDVVRLDRSRTRFNEAPVVTCGLAASLYWWQADVQRGAEAFFHQRVVRIEQYGTYACRNVNSAASGPRSEHATADAIDVAGFTLEDGRTITVLKYWGTQTAEGMFLKYAHDRACGIFMGVLGPDYNALHANHFHLDLGSYLMCH